MMIKIVMHMKTTKRTIQHRQNNKKRLLKKLKRTRRKTKIKTNNKILRRQHQHLLNNQNSSYRSNKKQ